MFRHLLLAFEFQRIHIIQTYFKFKLTLAVSYFLSAFKLLQIKVMFTCTVVGHVLYY